MSNLARRDESAWVILGMASLSATIKTKQRWYACATPEAKSYSFAWDSKAGQLTVSHREGRPAELMVRRANPDFQGQTP